ncbi:MAG: mechanosensitive ion channel [Desulfobacterales bacterium]|nr:mechanosensitive ion channel [Desulfobacterales bacterium]
MTQGTVNFSKVLFEFSKTVQEYLPHVLAAVLLLLFGLLISWILRIVAFHLVKRIGRSSLIERELKESGLSELAPKTLATVVFWASLLLFVAAAAQTLGIVAIKDGLSRLAAFLPSLLAAIIVLAGGILLGNLAKTAIQKTVQTLSPGYSRVLGQSARVMVLTVSGMIALSQIGIDSTVLILAFGLVVGGTIVGIAIAFGLGARTSVSNLLAARSIIKYYKSGQLIIVGDIEGRIIEISSGVVFLETETGRATIPAKFFDESSIMLVNEKE